jgi:hypothetical protein
MGKRRTISFTVEEFEYEEIQFCAKVGGYGGRSLVSSFVHHVAMKETNKVIGNDLGQAHRIGSGYVYIIQAGDNGPVKISFSTSKQVYNKSLHLRSG